MDALCIDASLTEALQDFYLVRFKATAVGLGLNRENDPIERRAWSNRLDLSKIQKAQNNS